jgi:hypothetical protein
MRAAAKDDERRQPIGRRGAKAPLARRAALRADPVANGRRDVSKVNAVSARHAMPKANALSAAHAALKLNVASARRAGLKANAASVRRVVPKVNVSNVRREAMVLLEQGAGRQVNARSARRVVPKANAVNGRHALHATKAPVARQRAARVAQPTIRVAPAPRAPVVRPTPAGETHVRHDARATPRASAARRNAHVLVQTVAAHAKSAAPSSGLRETTTRAGLRQASARPRSRGVRSNAASAASPNPSRVATATARNVAHAKTPAHGHRRNATSATGLREMIAAPAPRAALTSRLRAAALATASAPHTATSPHVKLRRLQNRAAPTKGPRAPPRITVITKMPPAPCACRS